MHFHHFRCAEAGREWVSSVRSGWTRPAGLTLSAHRVKADFAADTATSGYDTKRNHIKNTATQP
jgi:hypothetical protein